MPTGLRFLIFFLFLAVLTLPLLWKPAIRFDQRIDAYERQKRIDLKRGPMERIQSLLDDAREATLAATPSSATTARAVIAAVTEGLLEPVLGQRDGALWLIYFDRQGQVHKMLSQERSARSGRLERIVTVWIPPLRFTGSRAVGNAIRGLSGFSLIAYERSPRFVAASASESAEHPRVYGAWLWDRRYELGMALEVPAEEIDGPVQAGLRPLRHGRRFLSFLAGASYLIVLLALARALQRYWEEKR